MRRSAAPSQVLGNVAKKPRFTPPGKCIGVCPKNETKEKEQEMKLKERDKKEESASLLSKIHVQNQNENFTQPVESTGRVKTKAGFSTDKCRKVEMKTLYAPKADELENIFQSRVFLPSVYFGGGAAYTAVVQCALEMLL